MTPQHDRASQALSDPALIEEMQVLDHRIRFGPTQTGWISFIARPGQRPTILVAPDRETLMTEAHRLIRRRIEDKRGGDAVGCHGFRSHRSPAVWVDNRDGLPFPVCAQDLFDPWHPMTRGQHR